MNRSDCHTRFLVVLTLALSAIGSRAASSDPDLPKVLFFSNPMRSDNDVMEIADDIYQFKGFDRSRVRLLLLGRVFYTALGDWEPTWQDPRYRTHLIEGILWTLRRADAE